MNILNRTFENYFTVDELLSSSSDSINSLNQNLIDINLNDDLNDDDDDDDNNYDNIEYDNNIDNIILITHDINNPRINYGIYMGALAFNVLWNDKIETREPIQHLINNKNKLNEKLKDALNNNKKTKKKSYNKKKKS